MAGPKRRKDAPDGLVTIKKYANRRLYNTATSSYVTLSDLCQMVKEDIDFVVCDAKSGEDITRPVLTQIIVEEESKGQNLLPITFLRQLIGFYGDSLQSVVPKYLEHTMTSFSRNQEHFRHYLQESFDGLFPFGDIEEMGKQNMALLEKTMNMFQPQVGGEQPVADDKSGRDGEAGAGRAELEELRRQMTRLQQQIEKLSERSRD